MDFTLTQKQVEQLAIDIFGCVSSPGTTVHKLYRAGILLSNIGDNDRKRAVSEKIEGTTLLVDACAKGALDFVLLFLDDCHADVNQTGNFKVSGNQRVTCSPLWVAAATNNIDCALILLQHGADINSVTDKGSTPIFSACLFNHLEMAKLLYDRGADINVSCENGSTCLIVSVSNPQLCTFLIGNGAKMGIMDVKGNTALHYSVYDGHFETIKLLIQNGADVFITNSFNQSSLLVASLRGHENILEYFVEMFKPDKKREIELYELLGCHHIDEKGDLKTGVDYLKKGLTLRASGGVSLAKHLPSRVHAAYGHNKETSNMAEYDAMLNSNSTEDVHVQSLLTRERILGLHNIEVQIWIKERAKIYAKHHDYEKSSLLYIHASQPFLEGHTQIDDDLCKGLVNLLIDHHFAYTHNNFKEYSLNVADIRIAFKLLVKSFVTKKDATDPNLQEDILFFVVRVICLLAVHAKEESEKLDCKTAITDFLKLNPRTPDGKSLLHIAACSTSSPLQLKFPNLPCIKLLVDAGLDINDVDGNGNTILHFLAQKFSDGTGNDVTDEFMHFILDMGPDVNMKNIKGKTAYAMLVERGCQFSAVVRMGASIVDIWTNPE